MDNRQFGESYRPLTEKIPPGNPERREILEAPRKWMHFFGETMQNYLIGEQSPDIDDFMKKIADYHVWSHTYLRPLMQKAREIDDPLIKGDITNEFTFHQINGPLAFLWSSLVYSETNIFSPEQITDMQAELAVSMAQPARRLKQLDAKPSLQTHKELVRLKGDLSEVDTIITLMELMKNDPRLIVLPAPERFESNRNFSNRNADILMINTVNKQIRGIQVKTNSIEGAGAGKTYDKDFVTVIDSAYELGNSTYTKKYSDRKQNLPGQIAMGLLGERPINKPPLTVRRPDFLLSRRIAVELSRGRRSFLPQAVHHLKERIIPDLEGDETKNQHTA